MCVYCQFCLTSSACIPWHGRWYCDVCTSCPPVYVRHRLHFSCCVVSPKCMVCFRCALVRSQTALLEITSQRQLYPGYIVGIIATPFGVSHPSARDLLCVVFTTLAVFRHTIFMNLAIAALRAPHNRGLCCSSPPVFKNTLHYHRKKTTTVGSPGSLLA